LTNPSFLRFIFIFVFVYILFIANPNKPKTFVDDPEKLYKQRRREAQNKKSEIAHPKVEAKGLSESPKESLSPCPKENQLQPPLMREQPQPERKIGELCAPDIIDHLSKTSQRSEGLRDQDLHNPHGATFTLHQ
jgi:hypothetical protein